MRLTHIDVCNAVLMTGSVSAAARLLHLSQPAVTKQLQSAERQLGYKLFTRDKNRMVPTEEALALQPQILEISSRIQRLRDLAQELSHDQANVIRVDCVPSVAASLLPEVIERFSAQFPKVICHLETQPFDAVSERLLRRQADLGFVLASLALPSLQSEPLVEGRGVCVAPHGTFARGKTSVSWKDMAVGRLIRIPASTQFGGLMLEAAQHHGEVGPGCITVTTNLLALKLAERGVGLAAIDSFTAAHADPRKVQVLPIQPQIRVQLTVVRRNEAKLSHPARRFVQVFAAVAEEAARQTLAGGEA